MGDPPWELAGAIRFGDLKSKVDASSFSTRNPIQFDLKLFLGREMAVSLSGIDGKCQRQ